MKRQILFVSILTTALIGGALAGWSIASPTQLQVDPVYAACKVAWPACAGGDWTRTSTLMVDHKTTAVSPAPVEPQTGETWSIAVHHSPPPGNPCIDTTTTVTADVDWVDGTGWTVSCTGCNAINGPVFQIGICDESSCDDYEAGAYVLRVDIAAVTGHGNLSSVVYTTTSVDDGVTGDYHGG